MKSARARKTSVVRMLSIAIFFTLSCVAAFFAFNAKEALTQDATASTTKPSGVYQELEPTDGVFNDGKAALWDLHQFDHFKMFGPEQRARGYKPEQPIKFSHVTHVQGNKMECTYCHYSVNKSAFAAVPPVETCWGCHQLVKGTSEEQKTEIKKLEEYVSKGESIPWNKVHVFPDHVHFNHKRHVKAGVTCQECHGQIPNMQTVERASSMKMGWCVECHRQRTTSIDCYTCHY